MTMPDQPELLTDETVEPWHGPVLPVHIQSAKADWQKSVPPEFSGCNTWEVPNSTSNPGYVRVANRSYRRHRLRLWITSISEGATSVILASDVGTLQNGGGATILAAMIPFGGGSGLTWESQRACYATCIGGTATIITIDELFAEVREENL
jgi:hypothetical protein